ncbi:hypothetical protein PMI54_004886 [Salmonella enterica]|nr:hypothetical protein [Salmonella enterica subsp. enterica serovar Larochelle]ECN0440005.1 hypothetical protein [Salmonella enterica subsp. enterica serovar Newport]EKK3319534.1 hypothetical protein [Salmonella enterica]
MNEPVLVYSQQWPVAAALEALLARGNGTPVIPLYTKADLVCHLKDNPRIPLVFVLSPHEHVVDLYCLQPLLSGRPVLFVARRFYWTDCRLPAFCGLESYRCCTWDNLTDSFSRRMEMRYFQLMTADIPAVTSESAPVLTAEQIITRANQWLYREMENAGLSGYERMVLFLLSESRRSELSTRKLSYYKNSGLGKLGMSRHVINLYRGIKIRPVLQIRLF